jgi:hypothetical protein
LQNRRFFNNRKEPRLQFSSKQGRFGRESGMNIWTGLLFLDGAVADTSLARELAGDSERDPHASAHDDDRVAPRTTAPADRFTGVGQY